NFGGVVDFIDVGISHFRWYVFNVADSAVTVGIILYISNSLFLHRTQPQ
ncbi:MAG: signal peptidase II, partial [FCB group bacterium]|nr:signal peptidase II [FCB group bacterium]